MGQLHRIQNSNGRRLVQERSYALSFYRILDCEESARRCPKGSEGIKCARIIRALSKMTAIKDTPITTFGRDRELKRCRLNWAPTPSPASMIGTMSSKPNWGAFYCNVPCCDVHVVTGFRSAEASQGRREVKAEEYMDTSRVATKSIRLLVKLPTRDKDTKRYHCLTEQSCRHTNSRAPNVSRQKDIVFIVEVYQKNNRGAPTENFRIAGYPFVRG